MRWRFGSRPWTTAAISGLCGLLAFGCERPLLWVGGVGGNGLTASDAGNAGSAARPELTPPSAADGGALDSTAGGVGGPMLTSAPAAAGSTGGMPADSPSAGAAVSGIPGPATPKPEKLPKASTACPKLTGSGLYTFGDPRARTLSVQIYIAPDAGTKPAPGGPLILYWHGIGNDPSEVLAGFGQPAIDAVVERGGVVAAFTAKLCPSCGVLPDDFAWYNEDDKVSDHVVACAIEQASIDTRRIHAVGFSAGGIHTLHLAMSRSNYLASVVAYSGGLTEQNQSERQDPNNHVASLLAFGSVDLDVIVLNFNMLSWQWYDTFHALGWYTLVCPHGGAHAIPDDVAAHAYEFLLDHPYRVDPEPYAQKIPAAFPAYCTGQPVRP